MHATSNKIGLPLLASFFIIGGCLLIIGSWKRWHWLFGSVGVDWLSKIFFDNIGADQDVEYRQFFYYVIGIISILIGIVLLFLMN
jgi:hypothetical protein